jgi:hypothetical protein
LPNQLSPYSLLFDWLMSDWLLADSPMPDLAVPDCLVVDVVNFYSAVPAPCSPGS